MLKASQNMSSVSSHQLLEMSLLLYYMFSDVIKQFIYGKLRLLSVASTHRHTGNPALKESHFIVHKVTHSHRTLTNDHCAYMKFYHWPVCSTKQGHVIFFRFLMSYIWVKRDENVLILNMKFEVFLYGSILRFCGMMHPVCHTNNTFLIINDYIIIFFPQIQTFFRWKYDNLSVFTKLFLIAEGILCSLRQRKISCCTVNGRW